MGEDSSTGGAALTGTPEPAPVRLGRAEPEQLQLAGKAKQASPDTATAATWHAPHKGRANPLAGAALGALASLADCLTGP